MAENVSTYKVELLEVPDGKTTRPESPAFQTAAYKRMQPQWTLVDDVYTGTLRMREKATDYLPKFPMESQDAYDDRKKVVTLMNAYARTVDAMVGLVIGTGITLKKLPKPIEKHVKNIDNAGTEFEVFARDTLRDAFAGHSVILIDMPAVSKENRPKNKTEDKNSKLRPYWTRRKADEIVNWRTEVIDGETVITQMTFRECVIVPDGEFGEAEETHYLRWYLTLNRSGKPIAAFTKYREKEEVEADKVKRITYEIIDTGETHLKRLPVVVIYGYQEDGKILESKPPLLDLALKNVEHMQIDSDYKKGLGIAGIAIPVVSTQKKAEELSKGWGWDQLLVLGENEKFDWAEANGEALPNKRIALEDIKREMGVLGLSLIAERADANITATERLLDSVQQSNQLMAIQASLLQGLRKAFDIHAEWMKIKIEDDMEVALGLDWTEIVRSADHMQLLTEMAKEDFLSTLTFLEVAAKYGVLPNYVDPKEEMARLKAEGRVRVSRFMMKSTSVGTSVTDTGAKSMNVSGDKSKGDKVNTKTRINMSENQE